MSTGVLHELHLQSKLLKSNPLKNPSRRKVYVYTPPGYSKKQRLPCVLYMPGFGSEPEKWKNKDMPAHRLFELLILNEVIPPAILCCIDGMTRLGGSQYVNSKLNGPFLDHITDEIVPFLKKKFSVKDFVAAGHSSGGFGALTLASLRPDLFPRVASFAGDMHFELTHKSLLADFVNAVRCGKLEDNLMKNLKLEKTDYVLGLTAAYSPNLRKKDWLMDLPIQIKTGEIVDSVWKQWMSFDPLEWVKSRKSTLKKCEKIYCSSGDRDQFALHIGADAFVHRCRMHGIKAQHEIHQGNHSLLMRQFEEGLKQLLN